MGGESDTARGAGDARTEIETIGGDGMNDPQEVKGRVDIRARANQLVAAFLPVQQAFTRVGDKMTRRTWAIALGIVLAWVEWWLWQ